jgi:predicted flavoprotein YhiN
MIPVIPAAAGIPPEKRVHDLTRADSEALITATKRFPLTFTSLRGFEEAVVTQGGVSVKEIDPRSFEAKKVRGLYFTGEVLDLDALTGGYNLQIAWSTAAACAENME